MKIYYHWVFFVRDFVRAILLPVWVVVGGAFLCYLILQDVLAIVYVPVLNIVLYLVVVVIAVCFAGVVFVWKFIWDTLLQKVTFPSFRCWPRKG